MLGKYAKVSQGFVIGRPVGGDEKKTHGIVDVRSILQLEKVPVA